MKLKCALLCGLALAGANAMACYTVYDANSRVVYQGADAPVDMSLQLREALAKRGFAPGSRMQFDQSACLGVPVAQVARRATPDVAPNTMRLERSSGRPGAAAKPSPLFTDRETAEFSRLPHVQVAGDIVMVPAQAADRAIRPTVTVLPTSMMALAPRGPDTTAMGAGPDTRSMGAGPDTRSMGAGPAVLAPQVGRRQVVITELRDPPVTIINNGRDVSITN